MKITKQLALESLQTLLAACEIVGKLDAVGRPQSTEETLTTIVPLVQAARNLAASGIAEFIQSRECLGDSPEIAAIDIRKCILCRQDHEKQPLKSYCTDGLPHPQYTHWYVCPMADAPVGLYIEGEESIPQDDWIRDSLDEAMRSGRWLVAVSYAKPDGTVQHHQKNSDYPKDRILSRQLAEYAMQHIVDTPGKSEHILDWLAGTYVEELSPPKQVKLQTAKVPTTPLLFESQR